MQDGSYFIINSAGSNQYPLCLTKSSTSDSCVVTYMDVNKPKSSFVFALAALQGSSTSPPAAYLQHYDSGLCTCFDFTMNVIGLKSLDPWDTVFINTFYGDADGKTIINNNNGKYVFDASGDNPADGASVTPRAYNRGANQLWRLVSIALFDNPT